jgi:hypothetical protein
MKRALIGLLLGCLMTMGLSSIALAGGDNWQAAISVHITPMIQKLPCNTPPSPIAATMVTDVSCTAPEGYSVWILVCNGSDSTGIAGMEFGIDYDGALASGIDVDSWNLCADLEFPEGDGSGGPAADWPEAGTGTIITWDRLLNCQDISSEPYVPHTVVAIGGVLNVWGYGPDQLVITTRPVSGFAKVANCKASEDRIDGMVPSHLGIAGFCLPGYNPCGLPTAVEPTTWGRVKQQYN